MFVLANNNQPPITLDCASHVVCVAPIDSANEIGYCQNLDSFDECSVAQAIIANASQSDRFPIKCTIAQPLIDRYKVFDYRSPAVITTTTTTTTTITNTTVTTNTSILLSTSSGTTTPSDSTQLVVNFANIAIAMVLINLSS
jgi:hypothetical protein